MDLLQVTIICVLIVLTLVAVVIGIHIVLVLKEARQSVKKSNEILDNVGEVTNAVATPVATIAGIVSGFADSLKAVKSVSSLFSKPKKGEK
jgi:sensor domain CHASE-containing protein